MTTKTDYKQNYQIFDDINIVCVRICFSALVKKLRSFTESTKI